VKDEIKENSEATRITNDPLSFSSDKERELLSFTGKFDKHDVQAKDFETGQLIPDKYVTRYSFECYDFADPDYPSELSI
jgi:hypothetical protein